MKRRNARARQWARFQNAMDSHPSTPNIFYHPRMMDGTEYIFRRGQPFHCCRY